MRLILLTAMVLVAFPAYAQQPWERPDSTWTIEDCKRIMYTSSWMVKRELKGGSFINENRSIIVFWNSRIFAKAKARRHQIEERLTDAEREEIALDSRPEWADNVIWFVVTFLGVSRFDLIYSDPDKLKKRIFLQKNGDKNNFIRPHPEYIDWADSNVLLISFENKKNGKLFVTAADSLIELVLNLEEEYVFPFDITKMVVKGKLEI